MNDLEKYVEALLKKAVDSDDADDASLYAQAAFNAAKIKHELTELPQ